MWKGVSVVVKPAGELITLAKLRARLRITVDAEDELLADYLKGAIARIDGPSGIGYALLEQSWRKSMDCFPSCILLPGAPIKSVTAITYIDVNGDEQTVDPADYHVDLDSEPVRIEPSFGKSWPASRDMHGAVKVDYVLGESDPDDVAPDLIDAVCLLVGHRYENREAAAIGVSVQALPLSFDSIVAEYRRGTVAS